jgi:hypothetical protein
MKKTILLLLGLALIATNWQINAQINIQDDATFNTLSQMLLANELFESGEPFAEELGYNLDDLDPMILNLPDSTSYVTGIESYEYSRYLLNTLTGRSGLGLHMMWSPVVMAKAAMQDASFDGMFTGGTTNGFKEDDMLMMMIGDFGMNANQTPPANAFPQFADFKMGDINLPQAVAANFQMDFATTRWDRDLMDKTLNLGAMGQSMLKQYFWAQDMLGAFHDDNDEGIDATGSNSPDFVDSPNFDPNNNIFYGGNNLDGYIGQVLTAVSINKTNFLINQLAYDGTNLGAVNPATYDPASGIKYFPTGIAVTESTVLATLPPKSSALTVTDENSQLFDQLSYLMASVSFKNMMNPSDNSDAAHLAYHEVFDGYPFPADMATTGTPGPFDLMMGTSKVIFLNTIAMHFNTTQGTFVDISSLDGSGNPVMGSTISTENASYLLVTLSKFSTEFTGTPLQPMANAAIIAQANFIIDNLKDRSGGFYNSFEIGSGASTDAKKLSASTAVITGLYAAYLATNDTTYLTEANNAYNFLIANFYIPVGKAFKTELGNDTATYTPWNLAMLSGALRKASLVGLQTDAAIIYTRVFKSVFNQMILAEAEASGETGSDSDGDGVPYIVGGTKPFVFANEGTLDLTSLSVENNSIALSEFSIYPNPASEFISISLNLKQQADDIQIAIIDMMGRLVLLKNYTNLISENNEIIIPLTRLTSGSYLLNMSINKEPIETKKLFIK